MVVIVVVVVAVKGSLEGRNTKQLDSVEGFVVSQTSQLVVHWNQEKKSNHFISIFIFCCILEDLIVQCRRCDESIFPFDPIIEYGLWENNKRRRKMPSEIPTYFIRRYRNEISENRPRTP